MISTHYKSNSFSRGITFVFLIFNKNGVNFATLKIELVEQRRAKNDQTIL